MKKEKWNPLVRPDLLYPNNSIPLFAPDPLATGPLGVSPLGSYTGVTEEPMEEPVQDADDL